MEKYFEGIRVLENALLVFSICWLAIVVILLFKKKITEERKRRNDHDLKPKGWKTYSPIDHKRYLVLIILFYSFGSSAQFIEERCAKLDMIVCVDYSSSTSKNVREIREAVSYIANKADENLRIGIIYFTSKQYLLSPITSDSEYLVRASNQIPIMCDGTDIKEALRESWYHVKDSKNKKAILLISDGDPNSYIDVYEGYIAISEWIKDQGCNIFSLFVDIGYSDVRSRYSMQKVSSNGFFVPVNGYEGLLKGIESLTFCL